MLKSRPDGVGLTSSCDWSSSLLHEPFEEQHQLHLGSLQWFLCVIFPGHVSPSRPCWTTMVMNTGCLIVMQLQLQLQLQLRHRKRPPLHDGVDLNSLIKETLTPALPTSMVSNLEQQLLHDRQLAYVVARLQYFYREAPNVQGAPPLQAGTVALRHTRPAGNQGLSWP